MCFIVNVFKVLVVLYYEGDLPKDVHRPMWVACTENRVSRSSQSGSTRSFNPKWKLSIGIFATTISCFLYPELSCCLGNLQPLIHCRLYPTRRRARGLLRRVILQGNVTKARNHGQKNRSKKLDG